MKKDFAPEITTDVLIMGAGPAGLATALHLCQLDGGWNQRIIILEKETHPRPKLCGGGVTRLGLETLKNLGFKLPLPIPQARVDDIRLYYRQRIIHVRGQPQIAIFERSELDAYLAAETSRRGISIHQGVRATGYCISPQGVEVYTDHGIYKAAVLVAADGSKGLVRRELNRSEKKTRVARLLEVIQPGEESAPAFSDYYARFVFTPVMNSLQGYYWDFPTRIRGRAAFNRGVYDARIARRRNRAGLADILYQHLNHNKNSTENVQLAGHPIHWWSPRSRLSLQRLLLVGDAAGVDPLFGEGIGPALAYGLPAAITIQAAFEKQKFDFKDYRWRVWKSAVGRYLWLRWLVAWIAYRLSGRNWFMHLIWTLGIVLVRLWPTPRRLYPEG